MKRIVAIVGPTGVGKTEIGYKIALTSGLSIVSCDARQVYRYMDIGTAKPDRSMRSRVPHYMIDIVEPDQRYTAYDYARDGRQIIQKIERPIIVGGSGFYLRALVEGLFPMPEIKLGLRQKLLLQDLDNLYKELLQVDRRTAQRLHPNDRVRIIRALEVYKETGVPISEWRKEKDPAEFKVDYIGVKVERKELYKRIEHRVDSMIARGLIEEVKFLLDRYSGTLTTLSSIGYGEIVSHLEGNITLKDAVSLIKKNTKAYARRQLTWFRHLDGIRWIPPDDLLKMFRV